MCALVTGVQTCALPIYPRLSGPQLEHASRFRVLQPGGEFGLAGDALVEHEIMVISAAGDDLGIAPVADAVADDPPASEIEHAARDRLQLARRDQRVVHRRVTPRRDGQLVIEDAACRAFAEIGRASWRERGCQYV